MSHGIPAELRALPQWVARAVDKKPFCAPGRLASSTDPATWLTFDAAEALCGAAGLAGVGFVFSPTDNYTGIDLDKCRDPGTGAIEAWAQRLIERLNSYTEISPSGTGVHILVRATLPGPGRKRNQPEGGAVEVYDRARYFTVTGDHLAGTPATIETRQEIVADIFTRLGDSSAAAEASPAATGKGLTPEDRQLIDDMAASRDGAAFHRLFIAGETRANRTGSENDLELAALLVKHAGTDPARVERLMRAAAIRREKWDRRGDDYLARTIRVAIRRAGVETPEGAAPVDEKPRTLREIATDPETLRPPVPIIPRLAWRGRLTVYAAPDKAGKSTLLSHATACLANGKSFLGEPCKPQADDPEQPGRTHASIGTTLWAMLEEHVNDLAARAVTFDLTVRGLEAPKGEAIDPATFGPGLDQLRVLAHPPDPVAALRRWARELKPDVVVIDTLIRYAGDRVTDSGSAAQWTIVTTELQDLARELDVAVVVLHHGRKSDGQARDSGEITARADAVLEQFTRHKDGIQRIAVRSRWSLPDFAVRKTETGYELVDGEGLLQDMNASQKKMLGLLEEGMELSSWRHACKEGGIPKGTFQDNKKRLVEAGELFERDGCIYRTPF